MLDYGLFMQNAQRSIVRDILDYVSKNGLQEPNYFLISFQTDRSDVIIPDFVRAKYPQEITIVLQYQFENLRAHEDCFNVDLAFGGVHSTLKVPYTALTRFVDPSQDFGFELIPVDKRKEKDLEKSEDVQVIDLERYRKK